VEINAAMAARSNSNSFCTLLMKIRIGFISLALGFLLDIICVHRGVAGCLRWKGVCGSPFPSHQEPAEKGTKAGIKLLIAIKEISKRNRMGQLGFGPLREASAAS